MIIKKFILAFSSLMLISGTSIFAAQAESVDVNSLPTAPKITAGETTTASSVTSTSSSTTTTTSTSTTTTTTGLRNYHVTFLDFDGKVMAAFDIEEGDPINYTAVDLKSLHKHIDVNTEQDFSSWDIHPDFADNDYTIRALSKTATISVNKMPTKTRYFSTKGNVMLEGLDVSIKMTVQTPEKDQNGNYIINETTMDITSSCAASPSKLSEAFAKSDTADITVYPIGDKKALFKFKISCYNNLGDVNGDGHVDSSDASAVLTAYASLAASSTYTISDKFAKLADVDLDGQIDARDASYILKYYAESSVSASAIDWDNIIDYVASAPKK
ncbi:MAG: hypothetical protein K6G33_10085 [Ruminococcus sp.]|uniref:dockerin type I domain-containing protein n=1 Tax=Ruminococcus sp. TaxID=41978 RepID=UPI0025DA2F95|nr:dockerin type I domain-containing protein [Ruminococcus sp.]MCR5601072.1 hypothetical protein [Ruminococcus sp.]